MTQSAYNNGSAQRSTAAGTYTVGQDCSLVLKFNSGSGSGTSSSFVAPVSFRVQMVDSVNGQLAIQTEPGNTITGSFTAQ